jgi:methyltransferase
MRAARLVRRHWFWGLCGAIAVERAAELCWSRAHVQQQARRGGHVVREPLYAAMVAVHGAVLVAAPLESRWRRARLGVPQALALGALAGASALRGWVLATLGDAWSTRVTRFDGGGRRVVSAGPYRYVRHPNYLAVIVECAALPLAGGAWTTALLASLANGWILSRRIALEEQLLMRDRRWRARMLDKPRLLPRLRLVARDAGPGEHGDPYASTHASRHERPRPPLPRRPGARP